MIDTKDVLISIVNGNNKGYIYDCVASIQRYTKDISYDIVVIDNCTGDKRLIELSEAGVHVIINESPIGFARNHAQVLDKLAEYKYHALFNDDAFLKNDVFSIMIDDLAADKNNTVIAGCKILDPDGQFQPSSAPFPTLSYFIRNVTGFDRRAEDRYARFFIDYIDYDKTQYVDWVSGCCMLIDTRFIQEHGFLDVEYFMFLEDADFCRLAMKAGYKVKYIAEAVIMHLGAGSSKDEKRTMKPALYLETQRSRLRYLKKISHIKYLAYLGFIYTYLLIKLVVSVMPSRRSWAKELLSELPERPLL